MAWIELHQGLREHRKMFACAEVLNISKIEMVGTLVCLWLWALDNAQDGSLAGVSDKTIARVCEFPEKKASKLVSALVETGWLDYDGETYFIHDWHDYAGKLMERRAKDRERKQTGKGIRKNSDGIPSDVHGNSRSTVPIPYPNRTVQYSTNSKSHYSGRNTEDGSGEILKAPPLSDESFDEFFVRYPDQVAYDKALEAWRDLPEDATLDGILASLEAWKKSSQWKDQGGRYIPRASKWLAEGHWRTMPKPSENEDIPKGASGQLGEAELEAIRRTMRDGGYRFDDETGSWVGPEWEGK